MTTPTPPRPPAPIKQKTAEERGIVEITRTFRFITPLFGGGVWVDPNDNTRHDKKCDDITPARGSAIRGQLRFWWRATHGLRPLTDGSPHDLTTLRKREDALWGNASQVGRVNLRVEMQRLEPTEAIEIFEMRQSGAGKWNPRVLRGKENLAYAAFPLQPKGGLPTRFDPGRLQNIGGTARLIVTIAPKADEPQETSARLETEVNCAVDAWLTFGGLGGRTRRGFGAVQANDPKNPEDFLQEIQGLKLQALSGVTGFANASLSVRNTNTTDALPALEEGLGRLRLFRQGVNVGRNPGASGANHPGRSWWPEAESIRRFTGQCDPKHRTPIVNLGDVFPRAAFGMPIIFHFKDSTDPQDTTLMPQGAERRSSPLIIRPYSSNQGYKVMALVLHDPAATTEVCRLSPVRDQVQTQLTQAEANQLTTPPHPLPLHNNPNVLEAFLQYF